jgi:hypothetical protein
MLDPDVMAILTGAAGSIVAYMFNGRVDAARGWLARVFKAATREEQAATLRMLEQDAAAAASHNVREADLQARWLAILASYLAHHPEAKPDLEALAATANTGAQRIGAQINLGSGTLIGRDNFGDINPPGGGR